MSNKLLESPPEITEKEAEVRQELLALLRADLQDEGVDIDDPVPNAPNKEVMPSHLPIVANVLIPLGRILSNLGVNLRLLRPNL